MAPDTKGIVVDLKRIDTAWTKAELLDHILREHSDVPIAENVGTPERLTKASILWLHRLIHLGVDR